MAKQNVLGRRGSDIPPLPAWVELKLCSSIQTEQDRRSLWLLDSSPPVVTGRRTSSGGRSWGRRVSGGTRSSSAAPGTPSCHCYSSSGTSGTNVIEKLINKKRKNQPMWIYIYLIRRLTSQYGWYFNELAVFWWAFSIPLENRFIHSWLWLAFGRERHFIFPPFSDARAHTYKHFFVSPKYCRLVKYPAIL